MKDLVLSLSVMAILWGGCTQPPQKVTWVTSSPDSTWQSKELDVMNNAEEPEDSVIVIAPERRQQVIDGFGGAFNELGWEALDMVSESKREEILTALFDGKQGADFNMGRISIGANDYAVDWYSHNETKNDFNMEQFSIDRDKKRLIPYIKAAREYNSDLKIWASPWCPPTWMKKNNHYACDPDSVNDLPEEGAGRQKDGLPVESQFRMQEKYLSAYALYFSEFVKAYDKAGIDIYMVQPQNEPNSCQNFPSCLWTPSDLATFIGEYLGPKFEEEGLDTEIWLGTIERPQVERVSAIVEDEEAGKYIEGVGFQWGGKGAIPGVNEKYPDMKLIQTETECGDGSNDWEAAEYTYSLMKHYFNNGANSYMYWNMVLDETGDSQWGWKQNSMISIHSKTKEVAYNPEYYLMKHFGHFIEPSSYKIGASDENTLAFRKDETVIVIYHNDGNTAEKHFIVGDKQFTAEVAARSFNTFKLRI